MDKSWDAYCGLSLVHFLAFPECGGGEGPILESIASIADDEFFSGVEVTRIKNKDLRKKVGTLIEQTRLKVDFGVHPVILGEKQNINSLDRVERERARDVVESYLEHAADLNARRFVLLSGPDSGETKRKEATKALIESLQHICEAAKKVRLEVVLETFDRGVDKRALIGPAEEAAQLASTLRKDFSDFGLLYDQAHMVLLGEQPVPAMKLIKKYLAHVHVGNCVTVPGRTSYGDFHPRFGFPGSVNDVPELADFISALFEVGYLGEGRNADRPGVGFEIRPQPGESSQAIIANSKRAWREAWPLVQERKAAV
ncbi:MAG: TIM barrel protein [Candidatus Acidiferrales bacterium]